ncbi:MAG: hypothetical protein A2504_03285 [Bdellovibrionales bacterium RIFOXYD12_FULL_39_22]|nr:MAG: hypothetical protein A2385_15695 [Bdellovibrionales bacterium RIFOXYB1_FULL_39_21]OFZ41548.1 MAG: hypothetical protein A2485_02385 [Bdellovibrionales bacterium RIFOXYC12_FULL_39_17]OFZ45861.1 MAG: hypothetical protein A2404_12750 [Bdellovibrionales bacterium RIFOXYC1_FULL_39_130]OFZ74793.1 MAG: hypothetical protein A2560_10180 [Bdellovibrionales bacterium RIFOXYD1_FULL_39_84]OFZ92653.1 MAG: hypothetical protein A2504_03285 [Bdellovibrionales bacterium RIFOXYD12_FULL_39_22]HLE11298.1 hy
MKLTIKRDNVIDIAIYLIFIVALFHSLFSVFVGINNTIVDMHGFRQSQTALSALYMQKGGPFFKYETPINGFPWSMPLEFPLYQWIVAQMTILFNENLDTIGRVVNIISFYLALIICFFSLKQYLGKTSSCLIFISLILASPLYLFWSRTFLIDVHVFLYAAPYIIFGILYLNTRKLKHSITGLFFGILAGLVKITTFYVLSLVMCAIFCFEYYKKNKLKVDLLKIKEEANFIFCFAILPLIAQIIWMKFADGVNNENPLASGEMTSAGLFYWNFGTLEQKLSLLTWGQFYHHTIFNTLGSTFLVLLWALLFILANKKTKLLSATSLLIAILVFATFTNLHFVHNYYSYADGFLILFSLGLPILQYIDEQNLSKRMIGVSILLLVVFSEIVSHRNSALFMLQGHNRTNIQEFGNKIQEYVKEDEVLYIWGHEKNPEVTYYSQRRSIMENTTGSILNDKLQKAIAMTDKEKITGLVVCADRFKNKELLNERLFTFNLSSNPIMRYQTPYENIRDCYFFAR